MVSLGRVRISEFWARMHERFGVRYAEWIASDQVIAALGGRTVAQALDAGLETKRIWRAVCEVFEVPAHER